MSTETATITPAMCVAASDAAQELGIILPASYAGAILEAAWNTRSAPTPAPATSGADVTEHTPVEALDLFISTARAIGAARAVSPAPAQPDDWFDPTTYRKDGTLVCLLVERHNDVFGDNEANPTSDVAVGGTWQTVGWNNAEDTDGETGWQFAGWDWSQDCWTEGRGKVVGWKPYPSGRAATTAQQPQPADALVEVLEAAHQFVACTPAHWPDSTPLSMIVPEGEDEPEDADDPSPLTLGHLRGLAALRQSGQGEGRNNG